MALSRRYLSKLSNQEIEDIKLMLFDKTITYKQIAEAYPVNLCDVQAMVEDFGATGVRHSKRVLSVVPVAPINKLSQQTPSNLVQVDAQLDDAKKLLKELQAKINNLETLREELALRFEWGRNNEVIVYGIGEYAMSASASEWIKFFNNNGPQKLREFISIGKN